MLISLLPFSFCPLFPYFSQCLNALQHVHTTPPLIQKFAHSSSTDALPNYDNLSLITFCLTSNAYSQKLIFGVFFNRFLVQC